MDAKYTCQFCGKQFKRRYSDYRKHVETSHGKLVAREFFRRAYESVIAEMSEWDAEHDKKYEELMDSIAKRRKSCN